jgi:hypothetical protein
MVVNKSSIFIFLLNLSNFFTICIVKNMYVLSKVEVYTKH